MSSPVPKATGGEDDYVSCSVFVAVRARPFNSRERAKKAKCCLKFYNGSSVQIAAPTSDGKSKGGGESKPFAFDKAYSMDTPQEAVFRDMGLPVVAATLEGYNACIFAYGQTGSGKSFSMLGPSDAAHILAPPSKRDLAAADASGSDADGGDGGGSDADETAAAADDAAQGMYEMRGLIPRILEHVFTDLDDAAHTNAAEVERTKDLPPSERAPKLESTVTVSYLEIYQEKVRCLLRPDKGADLRVRNDPKKGAFVENLTKTKVTSAREALELLSKGNSERVVGSTNMNDKSSRSHAIFAFELEQVRTMETEDGPSATKLSSAVNLVDLAGSERAKSTGAEGERLKEGAGINKSLTVLGLVISGLADASKAAASASAGKPAKASGFIPYRDSKLTWLLKENLGGNSKTFMLSALSPADVNFDETLSTLRYADRAKAIVTKACVNEDAKDKVIRQLQAEVARLKNEGGTATVTLPSTPPTAIGAGSPDGPYLVGVEGVAWPVFRASFGCTLVIGRNPAVGNPAFRVVVGEPEDDDIAELHAELTIPNEPGPAMLRAVSAPDYETFVGDDEEPLANADAVELRSNQAVCFGDGIVVKFVDPRQQAARRARGMSRASGSLTARRPASTSPTPKPRGSARSPAPTGTNNGGRPGGVPPLSLTARAPAHQQQPRSGDGTPANVTTSAGGPAMVPKLSIPVVGGAPKTALARQGAPSTTRLANATPRASTNHARFADARDELMVVNNHTFVLLGDVGSGKSAFRASLGKEWSFFDKKRLPDTRPTLGFEVERLDRVGTTTKTDLTLLELSGNRAFTPLSWMVPPQGRSTFVIFFKLHGTPEASRCDLQYFTPFVDLIRSACPTSDNSILLVGTHRDCLPDTPDSAIVDMMLAIQTEISNYWNAVEPIPENRPVIRARFATSALNRTVIASTAATGRRDSSSGSLTARLFSGGGGTAAPGADPNVRKMTDMLQWLAKHAVERWRNDTVFVKGLVPKRLMTLLDGIRAKRSQGRFAVLGTEFKGMAKEIDERYSNTKGDLLMHTQLLHSWLRVYHHYRHTNLKRHVFVDVEWVFKIINALCCCGALVQRCFFNPPDVPPPTDAAERFLRQYPGLPFDPSEVKRADALSVLWTGLLTTQTAASLFRKIIAEKRYTATEVSVALDLLAQFDLTFSAGKLLQMPSDEDSVSGEWTSLQALIGEAIVAATNTSSPDPVHVLPGFFTKAAPETVTVFVPEALGTAGPTVCFTLHSVPVLFFSRLVTRLTRFSRGVFYGKRNFWGDCAWLVASDRCRVLLRLVSRSLFITFHDHEEQTTAEVQQTKHQAAGSGLTARGPSAVDNVESTLDDECYEAYMAMLLATAGDGSDEAPEEEREAQYLAIRRGMVMRRETDLQALIRQEIRDLIAESPGASFKERDRLPLSEGGKWREVTGAVKGTTMHEGQRDFLRLRELINKQQQAASETGAQPYFSPAPGEEADPVSPEEDIGAQAERLHERLVSEADGSDVPSHGHYLDVEHMLQSLTANRFLTDNTLAKVSEALEDAARARATVCDIEKDRFRLFSARDTSDDPAAEAAVPEKLPGLAMAQRHAMQSEVMALDRLVAALADADL